MTITNLLLIIAVVLIIPITVLVGILGIASIIETNKREENKNERNS